MSNTVAKLRPVHEYYDLDIINNSNNFNQIPAVLKESRLNPFLDDPSLYFMSIVRFECDTTNLPAFVPIMQRGSITNTIYGFKIYSGALPPTTGDYTYLTYTPQDTTASIPSASQAQNPSDPYYNVRDYQYFLDIINSQIATAWGATPPFFRIDPATLNISLFISTADVGANKYLILNPALYNLLQLPATKIYSNGTFPKMYVLSGSIYLETTYLAVTYYVTSTTTTPLSQWNPVKSIVISSTLLPIISNAIAPLIAFGTTQQTVNDGNSNNANTMNIVTDFTVTFGPGNTYKPYIAYVPTAEYRLISFSNGITPSLKEIELRIFWKDLYNNYHPLLLDPLCKASVKLLFRRIDYNINMN